MCPKSDETILDIGVSRHSGRSTNFLEMWYPYPEKITALAVDEENKFLDFKKAFPKVTLVFGDGRGLNFKDNQFDIVFSNAVVEHAGSVNEQKRFIHEAVRVGKRAFITTPNHWFPIDAHTLLPFAHWLPVKYRFPIYRKLGRSYFADINHLNLLTPRQFLSLFPSNVNVRLIRQRILGITSSMLAVVTK